jgi:uracil phosphoribosyltransferase
LRKGPVGATSGGLRPSNEVIGRVGWLRYGPPSSPGPLGLTRLEGALAGAHLALLRDAATPSPAMRRAAAALATLVVAEALRDLDGEPGEVATPVAPAAVIRPARGLTLVPVLRAGLALLQPALDLAPGDARVGFVGMARDETTLRPAVYLCSLPEGVEHDDVLVLDVMIATGGSAVAALDALTAAGVASPRLAGLIAAPEGLARIAAAHPGVAVTVAAVDDRLDERGFIVPGLGDAGDRLYGMARVPAQ